MASERPEPFIPGRNPGFYKAMHAALGLESHRVRRIVLDFNMNNIPVVYVEYYGDERMLSLAQTLEGIQVKVVPVAEQPLSSAEDVAKSVLSVLGRVGDRR